MSLLKDLKHTMNIISNSLGAMEKFSALWEQETKDILDAQLNKSKDERLQDRADRIKRLNRRRH